MTKAPRILTQRGAKHVATIKAAERGRLVTVMGCMSAGGSFIPPFFVFPGKKSQQQDEKVSLGPPGSNSTNSSKGWMIAETFLEWLEHFRTFAGATQDNPILLILDNHTSHVSIDAIEFARANFIDLLTIPPHTSHKLQPLDVGFFGPLKDRLNEALQEWQNWHRFQRPLELDLPGIFSRPFEATARSEVAINAFRKTGIWVPFVNGPDRHVFYPDEFYPEDPDDQPTDAETNRDGSNYDVDDIIPPPPEQVPLAPPDEFLDSNQVNPMAHELPPSPSEVPSDEPGPVEDNYSFDFEDERTGANLLASVEEIGQSWENETLYFNRRVELASDNEQENFAIMDSPQQFEDDMPESASSGRRSSGQSIDSLTLENLPVYPLEGLNDDYLADDFTIPPPPEFRDSFVQASASSGSKQRSNFQVPPSALDPPIECPQKKASKRQMHSTLFTSDDEYAKKKKKQEEKQSKEIKSKIAKTPKKQSPQVSLQRRAVAVRKRLARAAKAKQKPVRQQPGRSTKK